MFSLETYVAWIHAYHITILWLLLQVPDAHLQCQYIAPGVYEKITGHRPRNHKPRMTSNVTQGRQGFILTGVSSSSTALLEEQLLYPLRPVDPRPVRARDTA